MATRAGDERPGMESIQMASSLWEHFFKPNSADSALENILRENFLFQDLGARQIRFVRSIVHLRRYRRTEMIFRQGEAGAGMYIILKGSVAISVNGSISGEKPAAGAVRIATLQPGDFFGELALVEEDSRRSADARALEETDLIGFFKPDLLEILERNPAAGVRITMRLGQVLGRRLRETTDRLLEMEQHCGPRTSESTL